MAQISKPSNKQKTINGFDVTEATNTGVTDTNGNPIYLGDIVKIMPKKAKNSRSSNKKTLPKP